MGDFKPLRPPSEFVMTAEAAVGADRARRENRKKMEARRTEKKKIQSEEDKTQAAYFFAVALFAYLLIWIVPGFLLTVFAMLSFGFSAFMTLVYVLGQRQGGWKVFGLLLLFSIMVLAYLGHLVARALS